jgi:hypothetical protein
MDMKADTISIVEAAYECEGDERTWFRRLLEQAAPKLDRGFGVTVSTYAPKMRPEELRVETTMRKGVADALMALTTAHPRLFHRTFAAPSLAPHNTASANLGLTVEQARSWAPFVKYLHPIGAYDVLGVASRNPTGHVVFIAAPAPDLRRPTRTEVAAWSRIAAHICAGARLRRALPGVPNHDVADGAEAVLSPTGSIAHAEVGAQSKDARESLRCAAKAIGGWAAKPDSSRQATESSMRTCRRRCRTSGA